MTAVTIDYFQGRFNDGMDWIAGLLAFFIPWAFLAAAVAGIAVLW